MSLNEYSVLAINFKVQEFKSGLGYIHLMLEHFKFHSSQSVPGKIITYLVYHLTVKVKLSWSPSTENHAEMEH